MRDGVEQEKREILEYLFKGGGGRGGGGGAADRPQNYDSRTDSGQAFLKVGPHYVFQPKSRRGGRLAIRNLWRRTYRTIPGQRAAGCSKKVHVGTAEA